MPGSFPFRTLLDLSHARLDSAGRRLAELLASEQASAEKLKLLNQYRDEYQSRFMEAASTGITPEQWQNFLAFLRKIEAAIAYQQQTVSQSRKRTADGQQAWLEQRKRAHAFDTLSERHRAREQREEGRREQKRADEHAMHRYRTERE